MAFPHYVQGHIALNAKHYDAALRHFQTALDRDPTDADAQRYISFLHDRQLAGKQPIRTRRRAEFFGSRYLKGTTTLAT